MFADCQEEGFQTLNMRLTSAVTVTPIPASYASLIAAGFEEKVVRLIQCHSETDVAC